MRCSCASGCHRPECSRNPTATATATASHAEIAADHGVAQRTAGFYSLTRRRGEQRAETRRTANSNCLSHRERRGRQRGAEVDGRKATVVHFLLVAPWNATDPHKEKEGLAAILPACPSPRLRVLFSAPPREAVETGASLRHSLVRRELRVRRCCCSQFAVRSSQFAAAVSDSLPTAGPPGCISRAPSPARGRSRSPLARARTPAGPRSS